MREKRRGRGVGKEKETKEEGGRKGRDGGGNGREERKGKERWRFRAEGEGRETGGGGNEREGREARGEAGVGSRGGCGSLQRQCLGSFAQVSMRNVLTQLRPHRTRWEPGAPSDSFTELVLLKTCAQIRYLRRRSWQRCGVLCAKVDPELVNGGAWGHLSLSRKERGGFSL